MRVRIYRKDRNIIVETHFIRDVNTVQGFAIHAGGGPDIAVEIQAERNQVFTLDDDYLSGFAAGHVIGHGTVVWDDRPEPEAECPSCGRVFAPEED